MPDTLDQPWRKWRTVESTPEKVEKKDVKVTADTCHELESKPVAAMRLASGEILFLNPGNGSSLTKP